MRYYTNPFSKIVLFALLLFGCSMAQASKGELFLTSYNTSIPDYISSTALKNARKGAMTPINKGCIIRIYSETPYNPDLHSNNPWNDLEDPNGVLREVNLNRVLDNYKYFEVVNYGTFSIYTTTNGSNRLRVDFFVQGGSTSSTWYIGETTPSLFIHEGILYERGNPKFPNGLIARELVASYSYPVFIPYPDKKSESQVVAIDDRCFAGQKVNPSGVLYNWNSVEYIGKYAFNGCIFSTDDLRIPAKVNTIKEYAFAGYSNSSWSKLVAMGKPANCDTKAFDDWSYNKNTLLVASELVETYKSTSPYNKFKITPLQLVNNGVFESSEIEVNLGVGQIDLKKYLTANYKGLQGLRIDCSTYNPDVVSVEEDGVINILSKGEATIDCIIKQNLWIKRAEATIKIIVKDGEIVIGPDDKPDLTGNCGEYYNLEVSLRNPGPINTAIFRSEDRRVVDCGNMINDEYITMPLGEEFATCMLYFKTPGTTKIHVTLYSKPMSDPSTVVTKYVIPVMTNTPVMKILYNNKEVSYLNVEKSPFSTQLGLKITNANVDNLGVKWTSSNDDIVSIYNNYNSRDYCLFIPKKEGQAVITAKLSNIVDCSVTINVKNTAGTDNVACDALNISVNGKNVNIEGIDAEQNVAIYSTSGQLLYNGTSRTFTLRPGCYIVRAGSIVKKIIVN